MVGFNKYVDYIVDDNNNNNNDFCLKVRCDADLSCVVGVAGVTVVDVGVGVLF